MCKIRENFAIPCRLVDFQNANNKVGWVTLDQALSSVQVSTQWMLSKTLRYPRNTIESCLWGPPWGHICYEIGSGHLTHPRQHDDMT